MPRPIEFDREQALRDAMQLFWRQGYHKTSVRDLTEATRLQPGSLYGAFRNKRSLFLNSLDYYSDALQASVDRVLRSDAPPLRRIHRFFEHLLNEAACDPQEKGCLLVNTLLETPAEDREILQRAATALGYVEKTFVEVLEEAKRAGDLAADWDSEAQARLLMA
ncbi:MAG TPA: TetR/AcrR family transcriptional regulator, partial [Gammaproteobacteria bacterium]